MNRLSGSFLLGWLLLSAGVAAAVENPDPNAAVRKSSVPSDPMASVRELEKVLRTNNELSVKHFTGLIQKNPKDALSYARRGKAYSGLKDYDHALKDYNQAIGLDPKLADAYVGRAVVYLVRKDYDACWQDVHKAESLGGEFWPTFKDALKSGSGRDK